MRVADVQRRPRWRRFVALVAAVMLLAALVAWHGARPATSPGARAVAPQAEHPQTVPTGADRVASATKASSGASAATADAPTAASRQPRWPGHAVPAGMTEVEVCGYGRLPVVAPAIGSGRNEGAPAMQPSTESDEPAFLEADAQRLDADRLRARERVMAVLAARPDARSQAAAWLMREGLPPASPEARAGLRTATPLPRLALASDDEVVMVWALSQCLRDRGRAGCAGFSARHAIRRAPDNAIFWLALLDQEPQASAEVLHGLARSTRASTHLGALMGTLRDVMPADIPPLARLSVLTYAFGVETMAAPIPVSLVRMCRERAANDANLRQSCDAIATVLVDGADTLLLRGIGIAIGRASGWTETRLAAIKAESDTLFRVGVPPVAGPTRALSCDAVGMLDRQLAEIARWGEVGHLRRRLVATPAR